MTGKKHRDPARKQHTRMELMTGERKDEFERLRTTEVPRYLFRAWHEHSMGAPDHAINTDTAIIPPLFMPKLLDPEERDVPRFYAIPEAEIQEMVSAHYGGSKHVLSGFSSWAASLHLVLSYALSLEGGKGGASNVAVMDTHDLADEVLVWHVPHLLGHGNHEYLAFGIIRGRCFKSVSTTQLKSHGLMVVFPELVPEGFGSSLRRRMFAKSLADFVQGEPDVIRSISALFGNLSTPVAIAFSCIRPRIWQKWREAGHSGTDRAQRRLYISQLAAALNITYLPEFLADEKWLEVGMVNTTTAEDFPDVRQWIDLMAMMTEIVAQLPELGAVPASLAKPEPEPEEERKQEQEQAQQPLPEDTPVIQKPLTGPKGKKRTRTESDVDEVMPAQKRQAPLKGLRRLTYKICRREDCGKCIACDKRRAEARWRETGSFKDRPSKEGESK